MVLMYTWIFYDGRLYSNMLLQLAFAVFQLADRISVLVYGKLLTSGTAAEIQADAQVQAVYLGK